MSKFKVGDKVRVKSNRYAYACLNTGDIAKVRVVNFSEDGFDIGVEGPICGYAATYYFQREDLELVKPAKQLPAKYAIVRETFTDAKELRKFLKEHKDEKLIVYSVKEPVTYKITLVVSLKEK